MSVINGVREYCLKQIGAYPALETEIVGYFNLFMMEIDDESASEDHESELLYEDVDTLIEEYKAGLQN
jgi:hypothetical protein